MEKLITLYLAFVAVTNMITYFCFCSLMIIISDGKTKRLFTHIRKACNLSLVLDYLLSANKPKKEVNSEISKFQKEWFEELEKVC